MEPKLLDREQVIIKTTDYQPTAFEMNQDISIDATPEELTRAVFRQVNMKQADDA